MLRKLISNLPYNPSLIKQVSFYANRLHSETSFRRVGMIFAVIAMLVQFAAIAVPPKSSQAQSLNDIISGGIGSKERAVQLCNDNTANFKDILAYHHVSCEVLRLSTKSSIKSTDNSKTLYSMGRTSYGPTIPRTGKATDEFSVSIPQTPSGNGTYYMRHLWAWDSGASSTYEALVMKNAEGKTIMVLFNCGNIVTIGKYTPPQPPKPIPVKPVKPVTPVVKDLCPNIIGVQTTYEECDVCPLVSGVQTSSKECDVCQNIVGVQSSTSECRPCEQASNDNDTSACLEYSKKARNVTQDITDANGTTAQKNDVIEYSLGVKNTGNTPIKNYVIEEDITDILEYAKVTNYHGGSLQANNIVRWPTTNISSNEKITKMLTITVNSILSDTPKSSSNPGSYDLILTNVYHENSVNIKLPTSIVKTPEQIATTLPNTGPGTGAIISVFITIFIGYFFARSKIMSRELDIIKQEYSQGAI